MAMKKSLDIYGQGLICIDDMVYLDEIDEYVTKEQYTIISVKIPTTYMYFIFITAPYYISILVIYSICAVI